MRKKQSEFLDIGNISIIFKKYMLEKMVVWEYTELASPHS